MTETGEIDKIRMTRGGWEIGKWFGVPLSLQLTGLAAVGGGGGRRQVSERIIKME